MSIIVCTYHLRIVIIIHALLEYPDQIFQNDI